MQTHLRQDRCFDVDCHVTAGESVYIRSDNILFVWGGQESSYANSFEYTENTPARALQRSWHPHRWGNHQAEGAKS